MFSTKSGHEFDSQESIVAISYRRVTREYNLVVADELNRESPESSLEPLFFHFEVYGDCLSLQHYFYALERIAKRFYVFLI